MKKYIVGLVITATAAGIVSLVGAQTSTETSSSSTSEHGKPAGLMLQISPAGKVLIRGTINSTNASSLTVKSWGGNWVVNISASTEVMPGGDAANFAKGDFVGVQGSVNQNASWTVDATLVRDWTYRKVMQQEEKQNQQSVKQLMHASQSRNWQGTIRNPNAPGSTLFLTVNGTEYSLVLASGTKLVNRIWQTITLDKINNGDTVRVWGPLDVNTITASVLRDISLPAQTGNR